MAAMSSNNVDEFAPEPGSAVKHAKGSSRAAAAVTTELACRKLARLSGHPVGVDMTGSSVDEPVFSDDEKVESNVGKPAAEASSSDPETMPDPDTLTFRIRWRLSGNIETIQMLECATMNDMRCMLERQLDETAEKKTRVRLILGSLGVTNEETLAALWCKMVAAENFELGAMMGNGLACECGPDFVEGNCMPCSWCGFGTCEACGPQYGEKLCTHCDYRYHIMYECFRCLGCTKHDWECRDRCGGYVCDRCQYDNRPCQYAGPFASYGRQ